MARKKRHRKIATNVARRTQRFITPNLKPELKPPQAGLIGKYNRIKKLGDIIPKIIKNIERQQDEKHRLRQDRYRLKHLRSNTKKTLDRYRINQRLQERYGRDRKPKDRNEGYRHRVCKNRQDRRKQLFSLDIAGKGGFGPKNKKYTKNSDVRCS